MKRLTLAACLLCLPGAAAAQEGTVIIGVRDPVTVTYTPPVLDLSTIDLNIQLPANAGRPIDLSGAMWGPLQQNPMSPAPIAAPALHGEAPVLTIEGDGVRLPDEQFTLP